jgi:hypothetical protein
VKKVFIGGSRHLSHLGADVRRRLDRIKEQNLSVIIGDANGADKAVQIYLHSSGYRNVEVFCSGRHCRNNVGNWQLRTVSTSSPKGTYDYYAAKDRLMASEASLGFMIWDGKSKGTLLNIFRLLKNDKKVVVYRSPDKRFCELTKKSDWHDFALDRLDLKRSVEHIEASENEVRDSQQDLSLTVP